jgi:amidase/aspartyl-tRNA(Asn)/glutamyl-tRNA(Gln) amidotransferase subunit A
MDDLAPRIRAAFEAALDQLRAAGLQIDLVDLHELAELPELTAQGGITAAEAWQVHGARLADHEAAYDPRVVARVRRGAAIDEAMLARLRHHRADWQQRLAARLALYDAVLSPTVPIEPPEIAALQASDSAFFEANALLLRNPMVVNLADGCAISLPCQGPGALPVGLMLWSTQGRDDALLDLALAVEGALEAARG